MKKLLAVTLAFCFYSADAGLLSTIKSGIGNLSGKAANFLDKQVAGRTAGSVSTNGTTISNPTLQTELVNALNAMYLEATNIRRKNLLKPKTLYYASNLCITLQKCLNVPSSTSTNISIIENYIKELQNRNVDVTNLNSQLVSLKTSSLNFNNSMVSINNSTIDQTVKQELITIMTEMNTEATQISNTHLSDLVVVTNSTLLQKKLQECVANPTGISASIDTMSGYIQNLQGKGIDVMSLNQKLALLKEKVTRLTKSVSTVDISKVGSNILGEFLTASNELQMEIAQIQGTNSSNAQLVSYSGQIYSVLQSCSQTFVVTQNHMSALNQYVQWVQGQGIDVTNLNQKVTNFNTKATNLNNAVTAANTASTASVGTVTGASTATSTATTNVVPVTGATVPTTPVTTTNVVPVTSTAVPTEVSTR